MAGLIALSEALKVNASLTSADLSSNNLGLDQNYDPDSTGIEAIAAALNVNASITNLNLEDNEIGKDGAVALGKALEVNASLKSLK